MIATMLRFLIKFEYGEPDDIGMRYAVRGAWLVQVPVKETSLADLFGGNGNGRTIPVDLSAVLSGMMGMGL